MKLIKKLLLAAIILGGLHVATHSSFAMQPQAQPIGLIGHTANITKVFLSAFLLGATIPLVEGLEQSPLGIPIRMAGYVPYFGKFIKLAPFLGVVLVAVRLAGIHEDQMDQKSIFLPALIGMFLGWTTALTVYQTGGSFALESFILNAVENINSLIKRVGEKTVLKAGLH
jgi:hypothetical protein